MGFELWIGFVIASTLLLASPGPTVLVAVSNAMHHGKLAAVPTVLGATLGDCVAMTGSLLGAGAILTTSATLFSLLKLFGAAYLIWMGVQLVMQKSASAERTTQNARYDGWRMFRNAFAVTALHPGGFVFFIAFVPLFIDPTQPALMQFAILEITFLCLAALNITLWVLLASRLHGAMIKPAVLRAFDKISGAILITFGTVMAFSNIKD